MSGEPAYKQVADKIRRLILNKKLQPGDQLPSIAELMQDNNVSITVARRALDELRREGLTVTQQGKGTFVLKELAVEPSPEFQEIMRRLDGMQSAMDRLDARLSELERSPGEPRPPSRKAKKASQ